MFVIAVTIWLLQHPRIEAQTGAGGNRTVPRLADGRPDLQGVWDYKTITPLDRPQKFADQKVLTDKDAAALADQAREQQRVAIQRRADMDRGTSAADRRTSLIEDPPDGKLPSLTAGAVIQKGSTYAEFPADPPIRYRSGGAAPDGPETRGLAERCLMGFNAGPPMDPGGYNNMVQIYQTSRYVVLVTEMIHDARIVPLDGRPHLPDVITQWKGDSRGHWDGDTLVIETTNFTNKTASFERSSVRSARNDEAITALGAAGRSLRLTERFSRPSKDILRYEYTVDDSATFTRLSLLKTLFAPNLFHLRSTCAVTSTEERHRVALSWLLGPQIRSDTLGRAD
jgi:hypothetical protein